MSFNRIPVQPHLFAIGSSDPNRVAAADLPEYALPLDLDWLETFMPEANCIEIVGGPGSGKTTALKHLADLAGPDSKIAFLDEPSLVEMYHAIKTSAVVFVWGSPVAPPPGLRFQLAAWDRDDLVEYLLAVAPERCRSVMARIQAAGDDAVVEGIPELWHTVLDAMIADDSIVTVSSALRAALDSLLPDEEMQAAAEHYAFAELMHHDEDIEKSFLDLQKLNPDNRSYRLLRHNCIRTLLASGYFAWLLEGDHAADYLAENISCDLLESTAALLSSRGIDRLQRLLAAGQRSCHPMAATLLQAANAPWNVPAQQRINLAGAILKNRKWGAVNLERAELMFASLEQAEMNAANLDFADVTGAVFSHSQLNRASLHRVKGPRADFSHAWLTHAHCASARFQRASFHGANLSNACLNDANLQSADLSESLFVGASLSGANLMGARIEGADFSKVCFKGAYLDGLPLRTACFKEADFTDAFLTDCDMEEMVLPDASCRGATLCNAYLTGSIMPKACFFKARLNGARLADIQWEGANLRFADLRQCIFHLGSTRSGLVDSPIACEGSRMDFYSDDFDSQTYRRPEEIRKANLCGADLRNAAIEDTDFYLVDLRGAQYTAKQYAHFCRCRAILFDRS